MLSLKRGIPIFQNSRSFPDHIRPGLTIMNEIGLQLNGKWYDYGELQKGYFPGPLTDFEKATLEFCHQWVSGQVTFEISTSGSTGEPKMMTVSRAEMESSAWHTQVALGLSKDDHALLCLNPGFIAGKMMLVRSFVTGMPVTAVEPSANPFDKVPAESSIHFVALVPYQLQAILESSDGIRRLNALKAILVGGAAPNQKVKTLLKPVTCPVYATYGMTETVSHVALQRLNGPQPEDYFQVLPGVSISQDARGCLVLDVDYLQTRRIVTNDLVELVSPFQFRWLGRFDNVINTGGVKVIPEKIEGKIESMFDTMGINRRFLVAGMPDEKWGFKVALIVEGMHLPEHQQNEILGALGKLLSKYETPKEMRFVKQFVETSTQKIDRRATAATLADG